MKKKSCSCIACQTDKVPRVPPQTGIGLSCPIVDNRRFRNLEARFLSRFVITIFLALAFTELASAHDPGLSLVTAHCVGDKLSIHLAMARSDIERSRLLDPDRTGASSLNQLAREAFTVTCGGRLLVPMNACGRRDNRDGAQFDLTFSGLSQGELSIRSELLKQLPRGHRQFVSVRGEKEVRLGEQMLDVSHDCQTVQIASNLKSNAGRHSVREFLGLGVAHILTGYDHLLFLLSLLLVVGSLRSALQIITSFTCAHSITLALATLNVVHISPRITEPLIAVSIVYVGLENLLNPTAGRRWILTFGFGLIHGFGFASALRELGLGADGAGVAAPLFSFNLGVELGQLAIAALVLPLLWKCRASPAFTKRFVPIGSAGVVLAGACWFLQRTLS